MKQIAINLNKEEYKTLERITKLINRYGDIDSFEVMPWYLRTQLGNIILKLGEPQWKEDSQSPFTHTGMET